MTRPLHPLFIAVLACIGAGIGGCAGVETSSQSSESLADLPKCAAVEVPKDYQAEPAPGRGEDLYIVRQGPLGVCVTDFVGLEHLAERLEGDSLTVGRVAYGSSDSLTGDDGASNPMPGHGVGDPAASNPMPGHGGGDPTASNPMPGKDSRLAMLSSTSVR